MNLKWRKQTVREQSLKTPFSLIHHISLFLKIDITNKTKNIIVNVKSTLKVTSIISPPKKL